MKIEVLHSLHEVAAEQWNALELAGNPTLRHEFLLALEDCRCADAGSGWQAQHLVLRSADGAVLAALPLYLKPHSWGEFVFDWSWASAYARLGLDYYPKLLSAIPFTPATGPRLLVNRNLAPTDKDRDSLRNTLVDALLELAGRLQVSSIHVLFTQPNEIDLLRSRDFIVRQDCQFHWRNRDFATFDDFLATFRADKRKKALRERRRVAEAGVTFATHRGVDLTDAQWDTAMQFSEETFRSHGHEHYLNVDFFKRVSRALPDSVIVKFAVRDNRPVASAIFFRSADTLYGRYWGATASIHSLHFETCYFQGIDYCIEQGIRLFEPGTQGEHKIARGFASALTQSAHWIADQRLRAAIRRHAEQERAAVREYAAVVEEHLPFHRAALPDAPPRPADEDASQ